MKNTAPISSRYCFILGRIPELSILEIRSVLSADGVPFSEIASSPLALVISSDAPLDCVSLSKHLGGCIKVGKVLRGCADNQNALVSTLAAIILDQACDHSGRITFGLSRYTVSQKNSREHRARRTDQHMRDVGLSVKKILRERGCSVRFVAPTIGGALSSVQVEKNGLCEANGIELLLLEHESGHTDIGITCAVQAFEEYSFRDYQRPERGMDVGLLPPKIARMMVNLASLHTDGVLLDPFCGFGTILSEALDLGLKNIAGSDVDGAMVRRATTNIEWLKRHHALPHAPVTLAVGDATTLSRRHARESIDAIVTEPTLGPIVMRSGPGNRLPTILRNLEKIYTSFFKEARFVLKNRGRLIVVLPFWIQEKNHFSIPFLEKLLAQGFVSLLEKENLPNFGHLTPRGSILVARPGQHVGRELFVFEKK